jgi:hypothetical protein
MGSYLFATLNRDGSFQYQWAGPDGHILVSVEASSLAKAAAPLMLQGLFGYWGGSYEAHRSTNPKIQQLASIFVSKVFPSLQNGGMPGGRPGIW